MFKNSNSTCSNLRPGIYHGRVLELVENKSDLGKISSGEKLKILVLVEDRIYSVEILNNFEITEGSFISFNVNSNFLIENVKTEQIPRNLADRSDVIRWRKPSKDPSRMSLLCLRHKLMQGIREWFDNKKFIETETPFLVKAPSPESQIFNFKADSRFLITSPEFQMKRLLVGGFERIYQIARCFRRNEISSHHNPEFTMLEWYRSWEPLDVLIRDLEQLVMHLVAKVDGEISNHIPLPPWPRAKVRDLFEKHLDIFLDGSETPKQLMEKAKNSGYEELLINISPSKNTNSLVYESIFSKLWNKIENNISRSTPLFVYEWPLNLPSLAKPISNDSKFVDRVELYVNGMELANGFGELTDVVEQRSRFEIDLKNRSVLGIESVPLDEKFLSSLEQGLPRSSGMALGVDRLIMWLCSVEHIRDVMCFYDNEV